LSNSGQWPCCFCATLRVFVEVWLTANEVLEMHHWKYCKCKISLSVVIVNYLTHRFWYMLLQSSFIRSTPPSQPNTIRGGNVHPSVGPSVRSSIRSYVHPQKLCPISMKFGTYIEVDEWCMTVCHMTRFKVKVMGLLKFQKLHFSNSISSATYSRTLQMTTNS